MQKQKQQGVRKPRKLFSRDRSGQMHKTHRQSQKESDEKRISSPVAIPQQKIIKGLRNQLTNLKEEVAKLTSREYKKPIEKNEVYLEYKGYIDQQNMQQINVKYSRDGKFFRREYKKSQKVKSELSSDGQQTILKKQTGKNQAKMEEIMKQFKQFKLQNKQLMAQNEKLRVDFSRIQQKLKYSQEDRQRHQLNQNVMMQKNRSKQQNLQNRSFLFQKQNDQQKIIIQQLKETLESVNQSNFLLKKEIQLMREASIKTQKLQCQLITKEQEIQKLKSQLAEKLVFINQKQKVMQEKVIEVQNQKELSSKIKQERDKQIMAHNQDKALIMQLKSKINLLQKRLSGRQIKPHKESKVQTHTTPQIAQLKEIIRLQEKSMNNYESDLNYLEKQLKKSARFKLESERLAHLLEETNQECLRLNLLEMNKKYKFF